MSCELDPGIVQPIPRGVPTEQNNTRVVSELQTSETFGNSNANRYASSRPHHPVLLIPHEENLDPAAAVAVAGRRSCCVLRTAGPFPTVEPGPAGGDRPSGHGNGEGGHGVLAEDQPRRGRRREWTAESERRPAVLEEGGPKASRSVAEPAGGGPAERVETSSHGEQRRRREPSMGALPSSDGSPRRELSWKPWMRVVGPDCFFIFSSRCFL